MSTLQLIDDSVLILLMKQFSRMDPGPGSSPLWSDRLLMSGAAPGILIH